MHHNKICKIMAKNHVYGYNYIILLEKGVIWSLKKTLFWLLKKVLVLVIEKGIILVIVKDVILVLICVFLKLNPHFFLAKSLNNIQFGNMCSICIC